MTDNSFKLFAADPTPGHDPKKLLGHSKSTSNLASTVPRDFLTEDDMKDKNHQGHSHHHGNGHGNGAKSGSEAPPASTTTEEKSQGQNGSGEKKEIIRGPWRILRLLPRDSRHIIHRMLDLNPKTRAKMEEIVDETWIADTVICQQLENGEVIPAEDHTHVLEPPASQQSTSKT